MAETNGVLVSKREEAQALNSRGNALRVRRCLDEALASYDAALSLVPELEAALFNRASVLLELGRPEDALTGFDRVLGFAPNDVESITLRGNALADLQRWPEALASYDRALAIDPGYVPALYGSANALVALGRGAEAMASYDRVLAVAPDHTAALCTRGNVLLGMRRFEEAQESYDRALAVEPDLPGALMNRGNALLELGRPEDALACYDRALAVDPRFADALNNRGIVLQQLMRYAEAAQSYAELLVAAPEYDYALGNLLFCRLRNCDWDDFPALTRRLAAEVERGARVATPFVFLSASASVAAHLSCARVYADHRYPTPARALWTGQRYRHDRIRIAYLSADFRDHVMAHLMAGVYEAHDRRRFETFAISVGADDHAPIRQRLHAAFDFFLDVRMQDDYGVARLLHSREIDIAVDLMGYTTHCRPGILAHRPAPIQVNYLGFAGTIGAAHIDYILADRVVIPDADRSNYAEQVVYLPGTYYPGDSRTVPLGPSLTRAAVGLPEQGFVFCSLNSHYKITPQVFEVWMRLLRRIDGSVLWLMGGNAIAQANLQREASARGVSAERLIFASWAASDQYLAGWQMADLFLDTLPYNAHSTASDALRVGLPVLTCTGSAFAGRVATSLLGAMGAAELATRSLEEYEALAERLANDSEYMGQIRAKLLSNRDDCHLFDSDRFCRNLESAYAEMWERWQRGEEPAAFDVKPCSSRATTPTN